MNNKNKPKLKVVYIKNKKVSKEEMEEKLEKAYDVLFEDVIKVIIKSTLE